jgi:hypothetical protein
MAGTATQTIRECDNGLVRHTDGMVWPLATLNVVWMTFLQRETRPSVLQRETTVLGDSPSAEACIEESTPCP